MLGKGHKHNFLCAIYSFASTNFAGVFASVRFAIKGIFTAGQAKSRVFKSKHLTFNGCDDTFLCDAAVHNELLVVGG